MTAPDVPAATGSKWPHYVEGQQYVRDRVGVVWLLVPEYDGGMATTATAVGATSVGIDVLRRERGPLRLLAAHPEPTPTGLVDVLAATRAAHVSHIGWSQGQPDGHWNAECLAGDWADYSATGGGVAAHRAWDAHLNHTLAAEVSAWVRGQVVAELTKAADELLAGAHERAHAEVCRNQYRSDRTSAHIALDVAADWLRARALAAAAIAALVGEES